jgi:peptidoglycan/xylan/chitin deacetylase (PgdA/CDA1 family)
MWVNIPTVIKGIFTGIVWDKPAKKNEIYITFDDGPEPGITPEVLAFLNKYRAKATFFCLGSKVEENPCLVQQIRGDGHSVANHGYMHLNGYKTSLKNYIANAHMGAEVTCSSIFRPPYGKITPKQYKLLRQDYSIVMWSIMSMDFSEKITPEKCAKNVISNVYPGAVVVFHDIPKASKNLLPTLPLVLEYLKCEGYSFGVLD